MATVICPYVFENEIDRVKQAYWELPFMFERDDSRIGSDLMFEKMWKQYDLSLQKLKNQIFEKFLNL